jgi:hypothetical protein
MSNSNIMNKIELLQNEYYNTYNKNIIFKTNQKFNCANTICNEIGIDNMLQKTIYIFESNKIFIDYTIFKTFANPNNYNDLSIFLAKIINDCIYKHKSFEIHINLNTLTISAVTRYSDIINLFAHHGQENKYDKYLTKLELYYCPSFITATTNILSSFISPDVKKIVHFNSKSTSEVLIYKLFS